MCCHVCFISPIHRYILFQCIEDSGATFDDERDAAPELCEDRGEGRPGYFAGRCGMLCHVMISVITLTKTLISTSVMQHTNA